MELETGYYWCQIGKSTEKWVLFYDSLRKVFYGNNMLLFPNEIKVISPRIEEP